MGSFLSTEGEISLSQKRLNVLKELTKKQLESNLNQQIISLSRRGIEDIDPNLKNLLSEREFEELDISYNRIITLPSISSTKLSRFIGKRNRLSGDVLLSLSLSAETLTYIDLSWNYIHSFPISSVALFSNVSFLDLSHNPISELPYDLVYMTRLSTLNVNESALKRIDILSYLTSLTSLQLQYNFLLCQPSLPSSAPSSDSNYGPHNPSPAPDYSLPSLSQVTNLQTLSLSHSKNVKILSDIEFCSSLTHLDLSGLLLSSLPSTFSSLTSLTFLHLAPNQFLEFPPVISTLTNLEYLTFGGTQCDNIPSGMFPSLTSLRSLSLRFNYLSTLPSDFYSLSNLTSLDLAGNSFTSFPRELSSLRNIRILNFSFNQLTNIDDFFYVQRSQIYENQNNIFPLLYLASFESNKFTSVGDIDDQQNPQLIVNDTQNEESKDNLPQTIVNQETHESKDLDHSTTLQQNIENNNNNNIPSNKNQDSLGLPSSNQRNQNNFNVSSFFIYNPTNCPYEIPPTNISSILNLDPISMTSIKANSSPSQSSTSPSSSSTPPSSFSFSSPTSLGSSFSSPSSTASIQTSSTPTISLLPSFSHLQEEEILTKKLRLKDQILGCIFGHALGDAVGLASEFMAKEQSNFAYGLSRPNLHNFVRDKHRVRWVPGDWTDDTDQMLLILDNLIYNSGKPDHLLFAKQLHEWALKGFQELGDDGGLGIGSTTHAILSNKEFENDPHKVAFTVWNERGRNLAPNGGVMRTSILGIPSFHLRNVVIENTLKICLTTHYDQRCQSSCVAVTVAISLLLHGYQNVDSIVQQSYLAGSNLLDNDEMREEFSKYLCESDWAFLNLSQRSSIGYTFKAMGAGFYCLRAFDDFSFALSQIVRQAGDADSNGVVAGSLLGTKFGLSNLPSDWINQLTHKDWLYSKALSFLEMMSLE